MGVWNGPRIAVVGTSEWAYPSMVVDFVRAVKKRYPDAMIISGDGGRVDKTAVETAKKVVLAYMVFPADWDGPLARGAGFARNTDIVDSCDKLVAFWDMVSNGTLDSITKAVKCRKEIYVVTMENEVKKWTEVYSLKDIPKKGQ